jgi:hypothetical protein
MLGSGAGRSDTAADVFGVAPVNVWQRKRADSKALGEASNGTNVLLAARGQLGYAPTPHDGGRSAARSVLRASAFPS